MTTDPINAKTTSEEIVLSFIKAMNAFDYQQARQFVTDDLTFVGVLGTREGAEAYFKDMEKMRFQYEIEKAFSDGDDVCLIYTINMNGISIYSCGWYQLENGKISNFKVVFDPRPLLQ